MFWRFEMQSASDIDALLEKQDVTLAEILEKDDVLQECKAQNKKLIEFLSKESVVEELVDLITKEPPADIEESIQYRHPNMACELLTADITPITNKLADTESIFNKLWNFLDAEPPLNPLLASFFSKTVGSLLARRPQLIIDHIKKQEDCLGIFFKHLETSAIMDLILRLITRVNSQELRMPFLEWLNDQKFIQQLVDLMDSENSEEVHSNTAQVVCDIIRLTREHMSQLQECAEIDPLLTAIERQDTVTELLEHMFRGKRTESALVNGVAVVLSLLEFKKQSPDGGEQMTALGAESLAKGISGTLKAIIPELSELHQLLEDPPSMTALNAERLAKGVSGNLKAIIPKLSELHQLLEDPPSHGSMMTTVGKLDQPFGFARLQVCKLISALLITNTADINSELARLGTIKTIWDLFFKYMWNNFLHLEVKRSLSTILTNSPAECEEDGELQHPLLVHLFKDCKLVQRILEMWEANDSSQQQGGRRHGYMGHLTWIANCLAQELQGGCNSEQMKSLMEEYVSQEDRDRWTNFVSGTLAEMNKKNLVDDMEKGKPDPEYAVRRSPSNDSYKRSFSEMWSESKDSKKGISQYNTEIVMHGYFSKYGTQLTHIGTPAVPRALDIRGVTMLIPHRLRGEDLATVPLTDYASYLLNIVLGALQYDDATSTWTSQLILDDPAVQDIDWLNITTAIRGFTRQLKGSAGRAGLASLFEILLRGHLKELPVHIIGGSSKSSEFACCFLAIIQTDKKSPSSGSLGVKSRCVVHMPDVVVTRHSSCLPLMIILVKSGELHLLDRVQLREEMLCTMLEQDSILGMMINPQIAIIIHLTKTGNKVVSTQSQFDFKDPEALHKVCSICASYCIGSSM